MIKNIFLAAMMLFPVLAYSGVTETAEGYIYLNLNPKKDALYSVEMGQIVKIYRSKNVGLVADSLSSCCAIALVSDSKIGVLHLGGGTQIF